MKKTMMSMLIIGALCSSAFPLKLGLEFQTGSDHLVGANLRITDMVELKPQIGFQASDNHGAFGLAFSGNFYLPNLGDLQHYAGAGFRLDFIKDSDTQFGLDGHYGVRYDINDIFGVFGELGVLFDLAPSFFMSSYKAGVGCTFYLIR
ncbi:MAG: hypothetical protein GX089_04055 [Fibrobacter sp.]|nr:hypothetical protein [Fibrobacter sp.]